MRSREEDNIQKALIKHIRFRGFGDAITQCINNNPRSAPDGARLKAMGLVKGFPDLVHVFNDIVVFHELKTKTGELSRDQIDVHAKLIAAGANVITSHGLDEALKNCIHIGLIRG